MFDMIKDNPIGFATMLITCAAAVAAFTPTPKDDGIVKSIRKLVDIVALNFLNAKNEDK